MTLQQRNAIITHLMNQRAALRVNAMRNRSATARNNAERSCKEIDGLIEVLRNG